MCFMLAIILACWSSHMTKSRRHLASSSLVGGRPNARRSSPVCLSVRRKRPYKENLNSSFGAILFAARICSFWFSNPRPPPAAASQQPYWPSSSSLAALVVVAAASSSALVIDPENFCKPPSRPVGRTGLGWAGRPLSRQTRLRARLAGGKSRPCGRRSPSGATAAAASSAFDTAASTAARAT